MDKYSSMEAGFRFDMDWLFKKLRMLDAEKRALEEEVDRLRAQVRRLEESGDG